jgi:hypothetical protein
MGLPALRSTGKLVPMSELLAGLIGVVAGGLVTGIVQVFQARQSLSLKRRVAARLISGDLARASNFVDDLHEKDRWPETPIDFEAERHTWLAQREAFAAAVTMYDWAMVAAVYEKLVELADAAQPGREFTASERADVAEQKQRVKYALDLAYGCSASRWQRKGVERKWAKRKQAMARSD